MLLCKGKGCQYRKVCSRYVIGTGATQYAGVNDQWIDHCISAKKFDKFVPMHGTPKEKCPTNSYGNVKM